MECIHLNSLNLPNILNSIPDEDLENTKISVCKESGIDVGLEILRNDADFLIQGIVEVIIKW